MTTSRAASLGSSLLSFKEAAHRLSCSEAALRKWKLQGRIPYVMMGRLVRIRASDVEALAVHGLPKAQEKLNRVPRNPERKLPSGSFVATSLDGLRGVQSG